MVMNEKLNDEIPEVFSPNDIAARSNAWSGQALFLGTDYVIRQRYRMRDGKIIHLNLPKCSQYELTGCKGSWFLSGQCGGKRVTVHVFLDEVLEGKPGDEPESVLVLHLIVMTPSLGAEMKERFGADEGASVQSLMTWQEWTENRAALDAIYKGEPWLDGPDPIDLTAGPAIVAFAER